jgi:hypothetical protein
LLPPCQFSKVKTTKELALIKFAFRRLNSLLMSGETAKGFGRNPNIIFLIPTPVFGAGLIEAIPDTAILKNMKADTSMKARLGICGHPNAIISGTANRSANDGTITRFGRKVQNKSLLIFAGEAYNVEMGSATNSSRRNVARLLAVCSTQHPRTPSTSPPIRTQPFAQTSRHLQILCGCWLRPPRSFMSDPDDRITSNSQQIWAACRMRGAVVCKRRRPVPANHRAHAVAAGMQTAGAQGAEGQDGRR